MTGTKNTRRRKRIMGMSEESNMALKEGDTVVLGKAGLHLRLDG